MQFNPAGISCFFQEEGIPRNIRQLFKVIGILMGMVTVVGVIFHFLRAFEAKDHSWITGFCWTLTVMGTPALGSIAVADERLP